jgi:hypothetical protein
MSSSRRVTWNHSRFGDDLRSSALHNIDWHLSLDRIARELFPAEPSSRSMLMAIVAPNIQRK